jgi:hypothetical protein
MPRADALRSTAVVAAIAVLLILPWSVRNYRAIDGPALISSSAAGNFWEGHHEPGRVSNDVVLAHGPLSRPGGETDVSRAMWREGWEYVRSHPWEEIKAPFWKTRDLYKGDPAGLDLNDAYGLTPFTSRDVRERWLLLSDVAYYTLLIAAGIGLLASGWRSPLARLVAPVVLLWTLGHVAFFVTPRFHLPLLPVFAVAAGAGFAWAGRDVGARFRARRIFDGRRGQAIALVAAIAAAGSGAALVVAQQPAPESSADVAGGATRDDDRAGSAFTEVVHEPDIGGHRRRAAGHRGSRVRTAGRIGGRPHGLGPTTRDTTSTATDR